MDVSVTLRPIRVPWVWIVALILLLAASCSHLLVLYCSHNRKAEQSTFPDSLRSLFLFFTSPSYALFKSSSSADFAALKTYYLFALTSQLLVLEWMAVTVSWNLGASRILGAQWDKWHLPLLAAHSVLVVLLLFVSCRLGFLTMKDAIQKPERIKDENTGLEKLRPQHQLRTWGGRFVVAMTIIFPIATALVWLSILSWNHPSAPVALRSALLLDGLSPVAVISIIVIAYCLWAFTNLCRIAYIETRKVSLQSCPPIENQELKIFSVAEGRLFELTESSVDRMTKTFSLTVLIVVILTLLRTWPALNGIDDGYFRPWLIVLGVSSLLITLAIEFRRTLMTWRRLDEMLNLLEGTRLRTAFDLVPKELSSLRVWDAGGMGRSFLVHQRTVEMMEDAEHRPIGPWFHSAKNIDPSSPCSPRGIVWGLIAQQENGALISPDDNDRLNKALDSHLNGSFEFFINEAKATSEHSRERKICGEYLALRVVALVRYIMLHIRNGLTFVIYGYVALLLCVTVYPFQGRRSLGILMSIVFVVLLAGAALLLVQMDKDPILSRIEGSNLNEVSILSVAGKLLTVGGIPLLAVVASQFPQVADFIFSWVKPSLDALH